MKKAVNLVISNLVFLVCLLQIGPIAAVEIQASLSRSKVMVTESFQLTFRADKEPSGAPDFTPLLKDFEILNQSQSQNIQMINGNVRRNISWKLALIAQASGIWEIPAISFGNDKSNPITIEILEAGSTDNSKAEDDLFLKLEIEPETAYVQQQILLRVRLYHAVMLGDASLSTPTSDDSDTIIQRVGEDHQFETMVDGRRFSVNERRYALFPQKSGTLHIRPVTFQGEVFRANGNGSDMFLAPFGRFGQRGDIRRLRSEPISLDIRPIPPSVGNAPWLPSGNLRLTEEWPDQTPQFKAGEPVTRTLTLIANGLTSAQLPRINAVLPAEMRQYPDQPLQRNQTGPNGITGIRQEKIAIVPTLAGEFTLPAIDIPWWNTVTDQLDMARISERKIMVLADPGRKPDSANDAQQAASGPDRTRAKIGENPDPQTTAQIETHTSSSLWPWLLALVLGLGWLLTALIGKRRKRNEWRSPKMEARPLIEKNREKSITLNEVKRSCLSNYPEVAATALLRWAKQQWPEAQPRSLGALARQLGGDAAKEIGILERILYSPSAETEWHGENLWNALQAELDSAPDAQDKECLAPLHPT